MFKAADGKLLSEAMLSDVRVLDLDQRYTAEMRKTLNAMYGGRLYFYDIQHHSGNVTEAVQARDFVLVNFLTTVMSLEPISVPRLIEEDDWGYTGRLMTVEEFINAPLQGEKGEIYGK